MADEKLIFVRTHPSNGSWALWQPHLQEVIEMMMERRQGEYVRTEPTEIIEVTVTRRIFVGARVYVEGNPDLNDGSEGGK